MSFLHGFGYEWEEFLQLPSRKSAPPEGVEERQKLLDSVKKKANVMVSNNDDASSDDDDNHDNDGEHLTSNYDNLIRIRKDGRLILLKGVNLWNVYDVCLEDNSNMDPDLVRDSIEMGEMKVIGQAVWIRHVEYLD